GGEQRHHLLEGRALVLAHLLEERAKLLALLRAEPLHAGAAPRAIAALRGRVRCADDGPDLLHERPVLLPKLGADLLDLRLLLVRQLELLGQVQQTRTERSVGARRPFLLRARCLSSRFGRPEDVRPRAPGDRGGRQRQSRSHGPESCHRSLLLRFGPWVARVRSPGRVAVAPPDGHGPYHAKNRATAILYATCTDRIRADSAERSADPAGRGVRPARRARFLPARRSGSGDPRASRRGSSLGDARTHVAEPATRTRRRSCDDGTSPPHSSSSPRSPRAWSSPTSAAAQAVPSRLAPTLPRRWTRTRRTRWRRVRRRGPTRSSSKGWPSRWSSRSCALPTASRCRSPRTRHATSSWRARPRKGRAT